MKKYFKNIIQNYKLNISLANINIENNQNTKMIHNYLFLNKHSVKSYFIKFFLLNKETKNLKKLKKTKKKTFLFNF